MVVQGLFGSWFASSAKITGSFSRILARVLGGGFETAIHGRGSALGLLDGLVEGGHAGVASLRCGVEAISALADRSAFEENPDDSEAKIVTRGACVQFVGCAVGTKGPEQRR
jgi:hypothetical protein